MTGATRKMTMLKMILSSLLLLIGLGGTILAAGSPGSAHAAGPVAGDKIDPQLQAEMATLSPGQMTTAIVTMRDQADLSQIPGADRAARQQGIIRALQAHANASQKQIQAFLKAREAQGLVSQTTSFWVFNGLSVTAAAGGVPGAGHAGRRGDDHAGCDPGDTGGAAGGRRAGAEPVGDPCAGALGPGVARPGRGRSQHGQWGGREPPGPGRPLAGGEQ